jgi:hypothetical protein
MLSCPSPAWRAAQAGKLTRLTDRTRPTRCARRHGPSGPIPPDQHSQFPSGDREIPPPNNQINPPWLPCRRRHATPTATSSGIPAKPIRHSVGPCRAPGPVNNQHRAGADPGAVFLSRPVPCRAAALFDAAAARERGWRPRLARSAPITAASYVSRASLPSGSGSPSG